MDRHAAVVAFASLSACIARSAHGQPVVLDTGFAIARQATDLPNPTQMTFAPDGRLFVATRTGQVFAFA